MAQELTDKGIAALKPRTKRFEVTDSAAPGLTLRVWPNGARKWSVWYRVPGGSRRLALGRYGSVPPALTLTAARKRARQVVADVQRGADPQGEKHAERAERRARREAGTFADLAAAFDAEYLSTLRPMTASVWRGYLRNEILPKLGRRAPADLTSDDVLPFHQSRPYEVLRRLLAWAVWKKQIPTSPCAAVKPFGRRAPRPRAAAAAKVLTNPQLAAALPRMPPHVMLCALTAVREHEARSARWADIDLDGGTWHVPAAFTKGADVHVVPLSTTAVTLLARQPRTTSPWVFAAQTNRCEVCGERGHVTKMQSRLTREVKALAGVDGRGLVHRLRDTIKTRMSERGVDERVSEMILGHRVPGIAGTYNHAELIAPRRKALAWWAGELKRILKAPALPPSG